jgi:purine nucleoside phosphorylase
MRIKEIAQARNITIEQGIYVGVTGPSLETKAECAMMACWGADW